MWRTDKDVKERGARAHLATLEKKLRKSGDRDPALASHVRKLKADWTQSASKTAA